MSRASPLGSLNAPLAIARTFAFGRRSARMLMHDGGDLTRYRQRAVAHLFAHKLTSPHLMRVVHVGVHLCDGHTFNLAIR